MREWGLDAAWERGTAIRSWLATIALSMLPVLVATPADAQSPDTGHRPGREIIVKLRSPATQDDGTHQAIRDRAGRTLPGLETLHGRYHVREVRPLVSGAKRQQAALRTLRRQDKSLLTRRERHLLLRQRRSGVGGDSPDLNGIYRIQVDAGTGVTIQELLEAYRRCPDVEYAELSHPISICVEPGDPQYVKQWAMDKIGAPDAWDTCRGSEQVIVAVIDTGVDYNHRDLRANMWRNEAELNGLPGVDDDDNGYVDDRYGYNFAYGNSDPMDDHGHGTHCAGTIAAVGNNGFDVAGVCWNARIMALKILDATGDGSSADAVPAIYYAVANGADVISMSWGGDEDSQAVKDAIAYARRQGVLVVAAAGNEDSDSPFYPAAYAEVLAVAATESNDKRWYLSNHGNWVDIAAPGRDIVSLRATGTSSGTSVDAFTTRLSGTSMAAPHVAGACALLLATDPFLTCEEVEALLLTTGDAIAPGVCASDSRLNVAKAIRAAVPVLGTVRFDRPAYAEGDEIGVLLADWNLRGAGAQCVLIGTDGDDEEDVVLMETQEAKGVFRGAIASEFGGARPGDGRIQVQSGERIIVRYWNVTGGGGTVQRVEAYARADYEGPVLVQQTVETRGPTARIELTTSESTEAEVRYADSPDGPFTLRARDTELSERHSIKIARLTPGTTYYFMVVLVDRAGNEAIADNDGRHYSFEISGDFAGFRVPSVYPTIQAAIDDAWNGDTIWLADGTYSGEGNIEIDFHGRSVTVRSENGPQLCIIDCRDEGRAFYFHSGEGPESVVEGLTIINGGNVDYGGAIRCVGSSPTIHNCILRKNSAGQYGGGLCNCYGASPTVVSCTFDDNSCSVSRVLGSGGGMANRQGSNPTVQDCTFTGNTANYSGGGMANCDSSAARVTRCTFTDNFSGGDGGGVENDDDSHPQFTRCTFTANSANDYGGGMCCRDRSDVILSNCIFTGNRSERNGGALSVLQATATVTNCTISGNQARRRYGGVATNSGATLRLENSILWANVDKSNGPDSMLAQLASDGEIAMDYCCVQGLSDGLGGVGNIAADPLFVDANDGDYHLRSQGWRWDAGRGGWTYDSETSPCVDAGNPGRRLGEEPKTVPEDPNNLLGANVRIDMGAYGGTAEASMAPPQWTLLADMNNDRRVDWLDLTQLAADWAITGGSSPGDLSRDGEVNGADLATLARQWRHKTTSTAARIPRQGDAN